ncbi:MAG: hypothetical protein K9J79_08955 [Desulfobacteraceae bacterium]|nr:hypothetical protein [Desulfobacteraceae bacterium]
MKLIVCIKQIKQAYARTGMDPDAYFFSDKDHVCRVNPYDEFALELALRIKDAIEGTEVVLLTLGPVIAEADLRRCLAMGADSLFRMDCSESGDAFAKAEMLARAAEDIQADIILCGKESLDLGSGQVGAFIAERLNYPFVSAITDLWISSRSDSVKVQRSAGRGVREEIQCQIPAVVSVTTGPVSPRFASYCSRDKAAYVPIQVIRYKDGPGESKIKSIGCYTARPRTKPVEPPDSGLDAFTRIKQLLAGTRMEKKGEILTGDISRQVDSLLVFLEENGFLEFPS